MRKVTVRRNDLKKVVDYLLADEEKHYEETEPGDRRGHIFKTLRKLNEALEQEAV